MEMGVSTYAYAANNPLKYTEPTGLAIGDPRGWGDETYQCRSKSGFNRSWRRVRDAAPVHPGRKPDLRVRFAEDQGTRPFRTGKIARRWPCGRFRRWHDRSVSGTGFRGLPRRRGRAYYPRVRPALRVGFRLRRLSPWIGRSWTASLLSHPVGTPRIRRIGEGASAPRSTVRIRDALFERSVRACQVCLATV